MTTIESAEATLAGLRFAYAPITDPEVKSDFAAGALVRRVEALGDGKYGLSTAIPLHNESDLDDFEANGTVEWLGPYETERSNLAHRYNLECTLWTYMCTVTRGGRLASVSTSCMTEERVEPVIEFLLNYSDLRPGYSEMFAVDRRRDAPARMSRVEAVEWVRECLSADAFAHMDRHD